MSAPASSRREWAVIRDGRLASLHYTHSAASRAAKGDGLVVAYEADARRLGLRVGDPARAWAGQALPRNPGEETLA